MTLTEFLLARIAEDEGIARRATHQKIAGPSFGHWLPDSAFLEANGALERADREHIARFDPERVLAECEAKRRIVEEHSLGSNDDDPACRHTEDKPCFTLHALATVYADHPDYDESWRP